MDNAIEARLVAIECVLVKHKLVTQDKLSELRQLFIQGLKLNCEQNKWQFMEPEVVRQQMLNQATQ